MPPSVREHVQIAGLRCPHCRYAGIETELEQCPICRECDLEATMVEAVMLTDGSGPFIVIGP